VIVAMVVIMKK